MVSESESCAKTIYSVGSSSFSSYPVTQRGVNHTQASPSNYSNNQCGIKADKRRAHFLEEEHQGTTKQERTLRHRPRAYHHDDTLPSHSDSSSHACAHSMPVLSSHEESLQDRLQQALIERDEALYKVDEYKSILSSLSSGMRILTRRMKKVHTYSPEYEVEEEQQDGKLNMVVGGGGSNNIGGSVGDAATSFDVTDVDAWHHGGGDNRAQLQVPHSPLTPCHSDRPSTPQTPLSPQHTYHHSASLPLPSPFSPDGGSGSNRGRTWSNMSAQSTASSIKSYASCEDEIRLSQIISDLAGTEAGSDFNALHNVCAMVSENAKLVSTEASSAVDDARLAEVAANDAEQRFNAATRAVKKLHKERQRLKKEVERFRTERSLLLGRVKDLLKQKKKDVTASMKRGMEEHETSSLLRGLEEHVAEALMFHEKNLLCKSPGARTRTASAEEVESTEGIKDDNAQKDGDNSTGDFEKIIKEATIEKGKDDEERVDDKSSMKTSLDCEKNTKELSSEEEMKVTKSLPDKNERDMSEKRRGSKADLPLLPAIGDDEEPNSIVQKDKNFSKNKDKGKVLSQSVPAEMKKCKNNPSVSNDRLSARKAGSLRGGNKLGGSGFSKGFGMFVEILSAGPGTQSFGSGAGVGASSSVHAKSNSAKGDLHSRGKMTGSSSSQVSASCVSPPQKATIVKMPSEQNDADAIKNNASGDKQKSNEAGVLTSQKSALKESQDTNKITRLEDNNEFKNKPVNTLHLPAKKENSVVVDKKEDYKPLHLHGVKSSNETKPGMGKKESNAFLNAFNQVRGGAGKEVAAEKPKCLLDISDDDIKDIYDEADSSLKAEKDAKHKVMSDPVADRTQYSPASVTETRYSPNEVSRAENEKYFRSLAVPKNLASSKRPNGMASLPPLFPDNDSGLEGLDAGCAQLPSLPKLNHKKDDDNIDSAVPIKYSARSRNGRFVRKIAQEPRPSSCPPRARG